jgi:hypothetical protein
VKTISTIVLLFTAVGAFGQDVLFRTLDQGGYSGINRATNLVLRTQSEWEKLWKQHQERVQPPAKVPAMDFEKEMVVAVAMGQKSTGGYSIKITSIQSTAASLRIFVLEQTPGPDTIVTQALTSPFHFVAVPKNGLKAEFVLERKSAP